MAKMLMTSFLLPFTMAIAFALLVSCSQGLNTSLDQSSSLVPSSTILNYHNGPLLTGPRTINIYLIWYGTFYLKDRTLITDFFASFNGLNP
ncbi:hypothetical protein ACSBR2_021318 [Camellia fascicularis]